MKPNSFGIGHWISVCLSYSCSLIYLFWTLVKGYIFLINSHYTLFFFKFYFSVRLHCSLLARQGRLGLITVALRGGLDFPFMCIDNTWWKHTRCGSSWGWRTGGQRELTVERPGAPWLSCRSRPCRPQRERDSISTLGRRCAPTLAQQSHPQTIPERTKRRFGGGATEGESSVMVLYSLMKRRVSERLVSDFVFCLQLENVLNPLDLSHLSLIWLESQRC